MPRWRELLVLSLLLDTCVVLWLLQGSSRLSSRTLRSIRAPQNMAFVSAASAWEMAILITKGKLKLPGNLGEQLLQARLTELPVTIAHSEHAASLPLIHKDPFDRMLVAQAQSEELVLVTTDSNMRKYDVKTMAA